MMTDEEPSYGTKRWTKHFEDIDLEIARLAVMMEIPILDPGVIDRVLANDASVCGKEKPKAFTELRGMLQLHATDQVKAMGALGAVETQAMVRDVVDRLRERLGERLGNRQEPPAA
jgi:hypothetical protein